MSIRDMSRIHEAEAALERLDKHPNSISAQVRADAALGRVAESGRSK